MMVRVLAATLVMAASAVLFAAQSPVAPAAPAQPPPVKSASRAAGAPVVPETVAVQVMLDRAGFSPGEIDGRAGANLQRALAAFQRSNGLTESGRLDQATWDRLASTTGAQAPLHTYEITADDVAGPFVPAIPDDLVQQASLKALSYTSALESIAERFHASPRLLKELNVSATFAKAGEQVLVPNVEPFQLPAGGVQEAAGRRTANAREGRGRAGRGRASGTESTAGRGPVADAVAAVTIAVTKSTSALTVEDETGRVLFHAPVTSGSAHDPLPIGTWKITAVHTMPVFNYNPELFWDADPKHSKARIARGPNNPVGVAWIDLSKEHYGIHGTSEPGRIGHVQSHGCVRLTNWDVMRLLQWARPGAAVVFRE
jgi:lipoprotein-anchoring transpeptidase ErfK/SrfK